MDKVNENMLDQLVRVVTVLRESQQQYMESRGSDDLGRRVASAAKDVDIVLENIGTVRSFQ